jgi:hypothetical protein
VFTKLLIHNVGRDSSVGIATGYGLDGPGIESRNIPEEWLLRPDFNIWPPKRHRAVLWILIHLVGYRMKRDRLLTMNDFIDFMRRSKWKATNTANWTFLTGNYLQILDE